jgi:hypothetical protein
MVGAVVTGSSLIGMPHIAGAEVGVVEDPYCYSATTTETKTGTVNTITIFDADGDVVMGADTNDPDAYTKAKEIAGGLPACETTAVPLASTAALLAGAAVAAPVGVLAVRRKRAAARA